ncbi:MAG: TlpA family protein disulfide reductase [Ramlibacter sp.]|nr:TlpA family protein disulfide reductase [Ramlibacter sp.]
MNTDLLSSEASSPETASPARRRLLIAGAGLAAGLAGAGMAWWRYQPHAVAPGANEALWQLSFETPGGPPLALQTFRGRPLLINFWATWCPPCVEELPLLDRFYGQNSANGFQIIGLAIDQPTPVRAFLQKTPVRFPVGLAGLTGTDLGRSLGNLTGALPFTVVFNAAGEVVQRKMGKVSSEDLQQWLAQTR